LAAAVGVEVEAREPLQEEQPPEPLPWWPEPVLRRALKMWLVGLQTAVL
jgi:hypothetical protein